MRKKKWLDSYRKTFNKASACKAVKVNRSTAWRWVKDDLDFAEKVVEIEEGLIDEIEGKLLDLALGGNLQAIKTFLKAKAADRGYTNKLEISQNTKHEQIDIKRLELLLANPETSDALELIALSSIKTETLEEDNE